MKAELEQRLILEIADGLKKVIVNNERYVDKRSLAWADTIATSLEKSFFNKLETYCGDETIKTFIISEINRKLQFHYSYQTNSPAKKLTDFPQYTDVIESARVLVARLKEIPFQYRLTVGLPKSFSKPVSNDISFKSLSESIYILDSSNLPTPFPMETSVESYDSFLFHDFFSENIEKTISPERLYFSVITQGYAGGVGAGILRRQLEDDLKAFYGAVFALGQLRYDWSGEEESIPHIMIHRESDTRPIISTSFVEDDLWKGRHRLGTADWKKRHPTFNFSDFFDTCSKIYGSSVTHKKLYTACIWYYRARMSARPLDILLESTICIEVMLGEKDAAEGIGLTKLVGTRCSYMLGKNQLERDEIQKSFTALYKLRSEVVHAGKHRATTSERAVIDAALLLCGRIIAHELKST